MRERIAILAFHFRPDEAIGAVRPENWARWLSDCGQVSVITRPARGCPAIEQGEYAVLRPATPVIRMIDWLNGLRKRRRNMRATQTDTSCVQVAPGNATPSGAFTYRMPCFYDAWIPSALLALFRLRPEVVIATHSPYAGLIAAGVYKFFRPKTKLWLDFRDLWSTTHLATGVPGFRVVERMLEDWLLRSANVVTTVSEGLREDFSDRGFGEKAHVVYNAPTLHDEGALAGMESVTGELRLCYTGTIYSGWRDPSPLFAMFAALHAEGVISPEKVRFQVASRNVGDLLSIGARSGAGEYLDFKGALSRRESLRLQRDSEILVLLESGSPKAKGVLTGKVFEYLATDKPILLVGPGPGSELYEMLRKHDRLLDVDGLERFLRGSAGLPKGGAVDYCDVSRGQLASVLEELDED
jgi:glycosyltransferase involved in cell wall biosynthesis